MREEMKPIRDSLRATGWKGKYTPFGFTTDEISEMIEEENEETRYIDELQKDWKSSKLFKEQRENLFDVSPEQRFELRRRFLEQRYEEITRAYFEASQKKHDVKKLLKERFHRKIEYEIFTYRPQDDRTISEHEISLARQHPITDFISHNRLFAICPFHNEKTPSLYLKNNFAYCFGCNWKGDTIAFVMKIKGFTFPQAIKYLFA